MDFLLYITCGKKERAIFPSALFHAGEKCTFPRDTPPSGDHHGNHKNYRSAAMMDDATDLEAEMTGFDAGLPKLMDLGWMPMITISHFNEWTK